MIQKNIQSIFEEMKFVLGGIDQNQCDTLIEEILHAKKIV
jgi:hypothetical protein